MPVLCIEFLKAPRLWLVLPSMQDILNYIVSVPSKSKRRVCPNVVSCGTLPFWRVTWDISLTNLSRLLPHHLLITSTIFCDVMTEFGMGVISIPVSLPPNSHAWIAPPERQYRFQLKWEGGLSFSKWWLPLTYTMNEQNNPPCKDIPGPASSRLLPPWGHRQLATPGPHFLILPPFIPLSLHIPYFLLFILIPPLSASYNSPLLPSTSSLSPSFSPHFFPYNTSLFLPLLSF